MINKTELTELFKYFMLIFNKWIFKLFLILDAIGAFVQFVVPSFTPPSIFYGLSAIVGFFIAGYQVYSEAAKDHRLKIEEIAESNRIETEAYLQKIANLSAEVNINSGLKEPKIDISLLEGCEYAFDLMPNDPFNPDKLLPPANIKLNIRIENKGCFLDILAITVHWDRTSNPPLWLGSSTFFSMQGKKLDYPISMESDTLLEGNIEINLIVSPNTPIAQFASLMKDWRASGGLLKATIQLDTVDGAGNKNLFTLDTNISFRLLFDRYISLWQNHNRLDFVRLAGGIAYKTTNNPPKKGP